MGATPSMAERYRGPRLLCSESPLIRILTSGPEVCPNEVAKQQPKQAQWQHRPQLFKFKFRPVP